MQREAVESDLRLVPYPIDLSPLQPRSKSALDAAGIRSQGDLACSHPTNIAQDALVQWNAYLATRDEQCRMAFLAHARWLVEHERPISDDTGGWPIAGPHPSVSTQGVWLSSLTQGASISVLLRAYQLTRQAAFLEVAHRAVRTFERDILDGGVSTPVGGAGVFFEEVAVYPAPHLLTGFLFALLGLFDYVALTSDAHIERLMQHGLAALHGLLDEFDTGFWTRADLLSGRLATKAQLALQVALLKTLANSAGCEHCLAVASRWEGYHSRFGSRLRYLIASRCARCSRAVWRRIQMTLFPGERLSPARGVPPSQAVLRVCAPVTAFPVAGGMRTALAGVAQAMQDLWQIEYAAQYVGPNPDGLVIHRFGTRKTAPWQFPAVWLYFLAGGWKLIRLLRAGAGYQLILPQDGVFTAAFASLVARLAGVRVVCLDYGNMTLLRSHIYRAERLKTLAARDVSRWRRFFARMQYRLYWPSLYLLGWLSARFVDHFLVAGISGDGVEEVYCGQLGVRPSRITRYGYMVEVDRHPILDATARANTRARYGLAADALVITMICRLAPEKGIDIALESISAALSLLPSEQAARVRVILAGDGPLRKQIEADIRRRGLDRVCLLWGEASRAEVIAILSISDIFLHTSVRGAFYTMSILEAMASACAVVASMEPSLNAQLLAEGRGMVVPTGDARQTAQALAGVLTDPDLRCQMGSLARDYIARQHSATMLRRTLLRVTYWSALDQLLSPGMETNTSNGPIT